MYKTFLAHPTRSNQERGCPSLSYLSLGHARERYLPVKGEIETKKNDDINYWILAFASMTRMRGWIPAFARMTG